MIPGSGRSSGEGKGYPLQDSWVSLVAQLVNNPSEMQETWVRSPGEGKGYSLQDSGLKNSVDCIVHGVTESDTTVQPSLSSPSVWLCHKFVIKLELSVYISFSITWVSVLNLYVLYLLSDV